MPAKLTDSQVDTLRNYRKAWMLREVYIVTEWKDDCVYRTKSLGYIICNSDYRLENAQIHSIPTSQSRRIL